MKLLPGLFAVLITFLSSDPSAAQDKTATPANDGWKISSAASESAFEARFDQPCADGRAADFPCRNIDLMAYLPIDDIGGRRVDGNLVTSLNDIWGWTDPETGKEYALVGRTDGTSFVDVTDPAAPIYLGNLPAHNGLGSTWRDVKTIDHYAVIVADLTGHPHGMQLFDLQNLRNVTEPPKVFEASAHFDGFATAHNIVVNQSSKFGYAVGTNVCRGLYMMNLENPLQPTSSGCFEDRRTGRFGDGYTHDAQCVIYEGPDTDYTGREICFAANETHVLIADLSDKEQPSPISIAEYPMVRYAHQGWLTEDHRYFLQDDELDEACENFFPNCETDIKQTRTLIWDVIDLDDPQLAKIYSASTRSIDHNQYTLENRAFQSNYTSGLRILDISDPTNPSEVGFFDTYPAHDSAQFSGAWSNYPYFESGSVVVSSIREGLFVLRPTGAADVDAEEPQHEIPQGFALLPSYPNPFNTRTTAALVIDRPQRIRVAVFDARGKEVAELFSGYAPEPERREFVFDAKDMASGIYFIRAFGSSGSQTTAVTLQK